MTKPVRLDEDAQEELDAAVAWYDAQTGRAEIGTELLDAVDSAIGRISRSPEVFPIAFDRPADIVVRRYRMRTFPYALIFMDLDDEIRVLAVAHVRRRPGY